MMSGALGAPLALSLFAAEDDTETITTGRGGWGVLRGGEEGMSVAYVLGHVLWPFGHRQRLAERLGKVDSESLIEIGVFGGIASPIEGIGTLSANRLVAQRFTGRGSWQWSRFQRLMRGANTYGGSQQVCVARWF